MNRPEEVSCEEWPRTLGLSGLEKRRLRGDFIALYSFPRRGRGDGAADHFYLESSDRIYGNTSKLHLGYLAGHLDTFLYGEVGQTLKQAS